MVYFYSMKIGSVLWEGRGWLSVCVCSVYVWVLFFYMMVLLLHAR